jgi:hypothetical protein
MADIGTKSTDVPIQLDSLDFLTEQPAITLWLREMAAPDDAAVKKLKDLTAQLDKARTAGKAAVKEVASARQKAATATRLIRTARREKTRKHVGKKR